MKSRDNFQDKLTGIVNFDLEADMLPEVGAGGVTFKNTIVDFEQILTVKHFNQDVETNIHHQLDNELFYFTLFTKGREFELEIDLFTGKICSMTISKGYKGKLMKDIGIGSRISELMKLDPGIYFNLDYHAFMRSPFDGLVIYAPHKLVDRIYDAELEGKPIPDFSIETIEIVEMEFARKNFETLDFKT